MPINLFCDYYGDSICIGTITYCNITMTIEIKNNEKPEDFTEFYENEINFYKDDDIYNLFHYNENIKYPIGYNLKFKCTTHNGNDRKLPCDYISIVDVLKTYNPIVSKIMDNYLTKRNTNEYYKAAKDKFKPFVCNNLIANVELYSGYTKGNERYSTVVSENNIFNETFYNERAIIETKGDEKIVFDEHCDKSIIGYDYYGYASKDYGTAKDATIKDEIQSLNFGTYYFTDEFKADVKKLSDKQMTAKEFVTKYGEYVATNVSKEMYFDISFQLDTFFHNSTIENINYFKDIFTPFEVDGAKEPTKSIIAGCVTIIATGNNLEYGYKNFFDNEDNICGKATESIRMDELIKSYNYLAYSMLFDYFR